MEAIIEIEDLKKNTKKNVAINAKTIPSLYGAILNKGAISL